MEIEFDIKIKKCCVCGENATDKHWSIMGQVPFYVCKEHYEKTYSGMDWGGGVNRMGLIDKKTQNYIELKYYAKT